MNGFFEGITYNMKGLKMGLLSPKLLMLGLLRFMILIAITIVAAGLILANYQEITNLLWNQPQSAWILWLWHVLSWFIALLLMGVAAVVGFILSQLLFSALIMDLMSREVERRLTGGVQAPTDSSIFRQFFYLLRQELPRTMAPVVILMLLLMLGWFTPLGPVMTVAAPLAASIFLAWDNTDLVPARRQVAFKERFGLMRRHVGFHFGFGVLFLIPLFNIVLLSFAPVGGTLYFIERMNPTPAADPAGQRNL